MKGKKIVVALSGGKDSTAAILQLKRKGYLVKALFMKVGIQDEKEKIEKLRNLTDILDVSLKIVDLREKFREKVIDYFVSSYKRGLTPNPCVVCNTEIKFSVLWNIAFEMEKADWFATGHYAKCIEQGGKLFLKEPLEKKKSQIYFLSLIEREKLEKTRFPLSDCRMAEVRKWVQDLPLVNVRESQDVCFLQGTNLMGFLHGLIPDVFRPGDMIDIQGKRIGSHGGMVFFTIGQRRGTRFSGDKKLYVIKKDTASNTIMLGEERYLYSDDVQVRNPVFWKEIGKDQIFSARVRYISEASELKVTSVGKDHIRAKFKKLVRAISPGQICVFYENGVIVAAGHII